jgi:transcriptional regulator with XRE-family HTH domain
MEKKEKESKVMPVKNEDFYIKRVSHFFKSKRKSLKLTQQKMAEVYGVDNNQIWRMELGKTTTKLSSALRVIHEFAEKSENSPPEFLSYLLNIPLKEGDSHLSANEIALLKAFRAAPAELRREYAQLAQASEVKFALSLEIQKYPTPIVKKILELLKVATEK